MKLRKLFLYSSVGFAIWQFFRQNERRNINSIRNKVVIITGASSGIGRATARIFAAQGAHTVLVARRANLLADLQSELQAEFDSRVLTVAGDVTEQKDVNQVVTTTLDEFGRIDVLVNNAGILRGGFLESKEFDMWEQVVETNLLGTIRMTQAVLPLMKAQRSGHIVNVSSIASTSGPPGYAVYIASKSGINGFSESLRREVFKDNINVSIVMPGYTDTDFHARTLEVLQEDVAIAGMISVDAPDYVASNIVAAVRYNKHQVILGGFLMALTHLAHKISPEIVDFIFTRLVDPDHLVKASDSG